MDDIEEADEIQILADVSRLDDLFDNIIKNAIEHGFGEPIPPYSKIDIYVSDEDDKCFFDISNTGNPLPSGFDIGLFKRKGARAGNSSGQGLGGWLINEIIERHDGQLLDIMNEQGGEGIKGEWATSIQFEIPIYF